MARPRSDGGAWPSGADLNSAFDLLLNTDFTPPGRVPPGVTGCEAPEPGLRGFVKSLAPGLILDFCLVWRSPADTAHQEAIAGSGRLRRLGARHRYDRRRVDVSWIWGVRLPHHTQEAMRADYERDWD